MKPPDESKRFAHLSDDELVERFQTTGEMKYFEAIWRRHVRSIYLRSLRLLRNPDAAEDASSETFLRALETLGSRFHSGNLAGWLSTIARNLSINRLLSSGHRSSAHPSSETGMPPHLSDPEFAAEVEEVLNQLPPEQRITIKLLYLDGYTYAEIATLTGYSLKKVKSYAQNARRNFVLIWERARTSHPRGGSQ